MSKTCKKSMLNLPDTVIRSITATRNVSLNKACGKYEAYVCAQKKYGLGQHVLAADAAWTADMCSTELGYSTKTLNFANEAEYTDARNNEMKERRVNVPL